jgi:Tol biopolymer transport system component
MIKRCLFAVIMLASGCANQPATQTVTPPSSNDMLFGAGVFSTGAYELAPTFTLDGRTAYFTVSTPAYGRLHVIMATHFDGNRWSAPQVASFSGQHGDADPLISPDGSRLFFLSRRPAPGRAAGRQDFDVWYVQREGNDWGSPQHVPGASGPADEHYASVAADGTLYIAAIRPDSRNRGDVYRVPLVNGVYGEPENLTAINSPDHHDTTPYIAPDQSYMIFSSWGRPDGNGTGGDLYLSFRRNGEWTKPKNIGPLVNTVRTEYCPVVSHDGRYLYFTSERGFADAPLQGQLSTADLNRLLSSPGNGLGDTYRVEMSRVWDTIGERP